MFCYASAAAWLIRDMVSARAGRWTVGRDGDEKTEGLGDWGRDWEMGLGDGTGFMLHFVCVCIQMYVFN